MSASEDVAIEATHISRRRALVTAEAQLERMVEIRAVENELQQLFNAGAIRGSTHLSIGQEAVSVGVAAATRPSDWVTCTYRGHGMALALGVTPAGVISEIVGKRTGCVGGLGGSMHLSAPEVGLMPTFAIVGAGYPIALGAALTASYNGTDDIAIAVCGDGAVNIGAFHESLNLAAIWKLPVVFIVENNLYGEYTRIDLTTPITDLALRADSYGLPGEIVDGQDVGAVEHSVRAAADRARSGMGPTLLEVKTYRYCGHSRSDLATYRPDGELDEWLTRDPISLMAKRVEAESGTVVDLTQLTAEVEARISAVAEVALADPAPSIADLFAFVDADQLSKS